jgi:hypothetical protein
MRIDYDHSQNSHGTEGPLTAFKLIIGNKSPSSLLDVGCGIGTWVSSAIRYGVTDVFGVDGVNIPSHNLLFPAENFRAVDLTSPLNLGRRFDMVLCLEVAEHIDSKFSGTLIDSLVQHSDTILFSAACPGQSGQHHINCRWPSWWQNHFNDRGFKCDDTIRWSIWNDSVIEPWYRQNIFLATKDPTTAGKEQRIRSAIHPDLLPSISENYHLSKIQEKFETGLLPKQWYTKKPILGILRKLKRKLT